MTHARAVTGWPLRALGLGAGAALAAVATGLVVDPGRPAAGHVQNLELGLMRGVVTGLLIGPFAARLRLPARQRAALLLAYTRQVWVGLPVS